jgi:hypothetical protein
MRKIVDANKDGAEYGQDVYDYNEDIDQIKRGLDNLGASTDEGKLGASTDELFKKASKEETGRSGLQQGLVADQIGKRMDVATAKELSTFQSGLFKDNAKFAGELQTKVDEAARADEFAYGARFGDKQLSLTNQFEDSKFGRDVGLDAAKTENLYKLQQGAGSQERETARYKAKIDKEKRDEQVMLAQDASTNF